MLHALIREKVAPEAGCVMTVELPASNGTADKNTRPETVSHSKDEWGRGDVHTNTVENAWSLSERSIVGTYSVYLFAWGSVRSRNTAATRPSIS
jgi:hypothetical protein